MRWIRKYKIIFSAMFALLFIVFSWYHPLLFCGNALGMDSKTDQAKICTSPLFTGPQTIHSESVSNLHLYKKNQNIDKCIIKQPYLIPIACSFNYRTKQLFPQTISLSVLDKNCILRI